MSRHTGWKSASVAAVAAAFALVAGQAMAEDGVVVTQGSGNDLLVTVYTEAANVHFEYTPGGVCAGTNAPCYEIDASTGPVGIPVTASGPCVAEPGSGYSPSVIKCKADGVTAITFQFKKGGTWAGYSGGGGQHARGPCSPAPVTIKTGPDGGAMSVNAWNGCTENVICDSPPSMFTGVEADASDVIRGHCASVIRH
jgi:hypothetical protein